MKKLFLVIALMGAGVLAVQAQSNTAVSPADEATPVVNAADHMGSGQAKSCCSAKGQNKEACAAEKAATAAKEHKQGAACCASAGTAEAKSDKSCHSVSFGMGAAKPEKEE